MIIFGWLFTILFLFFSLTAFRGAPYIPTHRGQIEIALDLLPLQAGDRVVDLGSGDGAFLVAAARRGLVAYGYEINPILCLVAWWRCRRYRGHVKILWRDFWLSDLPEDTKAVFIFAAGPFMNRLTSKLAATAKDRQQPIYVASYGFALPGKAVIATQGGIKLYRIEA